MLADLGVHVKQALRSVSTLAAGIAIASRLGAGRIRHIHTPALWLQREVIDGKASMDKVHGPDKPGRRRDEALDGSRAGSSYDADGVLFACRAERAGAQGGAWRPQLHGLGGYGNG